MSNLFKKYCEIENAYCTSYINKLINENKSNMKYVITEKIHGSNIGYHIDIKTLNTYFASRTELLSETDRSNNMIFICESVFRKLNINLSKLIDNARKELKEELDEYKVLCVFGELFGGSYPHEEVERDPKATRINKGIYYTPHNYFNAFDIALLRDKNQEELDNIDKRIEEYKIELSTCEDDKRIKIIHQNINALKEFKKVPYSKYVDFYTFQNILKDTNMPIVPVLKITDSLQEALEFNKTFESVVYKQFNLPKIENNFAEGIVIKSLKEESLSNDSRCIIKNKNDKFSEVTHSNKEKHVEELFNQSDETTELINLLDGYINDNRLDSVLSKISGPYTDKDFGRLMKEFTIDVLSEFEKYNSEKINKVKDLDEYKLFTKALSNKASIVLRKRFVELINEEKYK